MEVVQFHLYIYYEAPGSVEELLFFLADVSIRAKDFNGSKGK